MRRYPRRRNVKENNKRLKPSQVDQKCRLGGCVAGSIDRNSGACNKMATSSELDMVSQMQRRLVEATEQRNQSQQESKSLDKKIRHMIQLISKQRPPMHAGSEANIEQQMRDLEYKRSTTSLSLNEEKKLLKEIDSWKQKKTALKEYALLQTDIDNLKAQRAEAIARGRTTDEVIADLTAGLKKLKLAQALGCQAQELVTIQVDVPESKFGAIIGKNGGHVKFIEEECNVCIDMDRQNHHMRITGVQEGAENAKSMVEDITCAIEETIGLHPDALGVLLSRRAHLLQEYKEKYGVRIDMHRSDGTACLSGTPAKVATVKGLIEELSRGKADLNVSTRMFPVIIGKGGSTIDRLLRESGANIELDRSLEQVRIRGSPACVAIAEQLVQELVEENEEKTQEFETDQAYIAFLIEDKGAEMKALRAEANVLIDIDRSRQVLKVKGTRSQLAAFEVLLPTSVEKFRKSMTVLSVDKHIISAVIGKGGVTVKRISEESGAKIDINRGTLQLMLRGTPEAVEKAQEEVNEIIRCNHRFVMKSSEEVIFALLAKGREELNRIQEEANGCVLTALRREGEVILTGTPEQVSLGKKCLFQFFLKNLSETIDVDDDEIGNVIGPGGSVRTSCKILTQALIVGRLFGKFKKTAERSLTLTNKRVALLSVVRKSK